jgi:hypothetical protein
MPIIKLDIYHKNRADNSTILKIFNIIESAHSYQPLAFNDEFMQWMKNYPYRVWTEIEFNSKWRMWVRYKFCFEFEQDAYTEFKLMWV